jgi:hypothetical protein
MPDQGLRNYDGTQIKAKDPKRYDCIVRAIREGIGHESIAKIFGIGQQTVSGISSKENLPAHSQEALIHNLRQTRDLCLTKFKEAVQADEVKADKLPVAIGILTDKEVQVQGLPSAIVAHTSVSIDGKGLQELIKGATKDSNVIDAEVVEPKSLQDNNHR